MVVGCQNIQHLLFLNLYFLLIEILPLHSIHSVYPKVQKIYYNHTIVTKLPLNTVSPRSQRAIEETVSIIFTGTTITGSMVAESVGPTTV